MKKMRNSETGQRIETEPTDAEWAKAMLKAAHNKPPTVFEANPRAVEILRVLLAEAVRQGIEIRRPFLRGAIYDRLGVKIHEATFTRYLNAEAPKDIRDAWSKVRRSSGRGLG